MALHALKRQVQRWTLAPVALLSIESGACIHSEFINLRNFGKRYSTDSATAPSATTLSSAQLPPQPMPVATGSAQILDGRTMAAAWQEELAAQVADIKNRGGRPPGLGVILVGDRPDSLLYVTRKQEACERIGMLSVVRRLPATITQVQLRRALQALCADSTVDGVLVQLPLPPHIDEEDIIEHFDPGKDVDGFHPLNVGRTLMRGHRARFVPCTALGCIELLRRGNIPIEGKSVAIVGDSNIVGMPLAMLFRDEGAATVTVLHRTSYSGIFSADGGKRDHPEHRVAADACLPRTPTGLASTHAASHPYAVSYSSGLRDAYNVEEDVPSSPSSEDPAAHLEDLIGITRNADILVVAVGFPHLIKPEWIKPGAVVLDVGINVVDWGTGKPPIENSVEGYHPNFHVVGDVDFDKVSHVASALTPVPGGIGPMTIAALLRNTVQAAAVRMGLINENE